MSNVGCVIPSLLRANCRNIRMSGCSSVRGCCGCMNCFCRSCMTAFFRMCCGRCCMNFCSECSKNLSRMQRILSCRLPSCCSWTPACGSWIRMPCFLQYGKPYRCIVSWMPRRMCAIQMSRSSWIPCLPFSIQRTMLSCLRYFCQLMNFCLPP